MHAFDKNLPYPHDREDASPSLDEVAWDPPSSFPDSTIPGALNTPFIHELSSSEFGEANVFSEPELLSAVWDKEENEEDDPKEGHEEEAEAVHEDDLDAEFAEEVQSELQDYQVEQQASAPELYGNGNLIENELQEFFIKLDGLRNWYEDFKNRTTQQPTIVDLTGIDRALIGRSPRDMARCMEKKKKCPPTVSRSHRSPRDMNLVNKVVLHHMAFARDNDFSSYYKVGAHYIILRDGKIGHLWDNSTVLNASNGFNKTSVAIEFAGNFPNEMGRWWGDNPKQRHHPTPEQIEAGRYLLSHLKKTIPTMKYVVAHRQSNALKVNDPGPEIWYGVGEYAISNLGYSSEGVSLVVGKGKAIPQAWRRWEETKKSVTFVGGPAAPPRQEHFSANYPSTGFDHEGESTPDQAVVRNRYWAEKLGWDRYQDAINSLLLPLLGLSDLSLGEEAFSRGVAIWQRQQGMDEAGVDGIIGPTTWRALKAVLGIGSPAAPPDPVGTSPVVSATLPRLGRLVIDTQVPALAKSLPYYQFTAEDAQWLARFVKGEAGGKNTPENHAVIFAMFNRYGVFRHRVPAWGSFGDFLRKYSTTLQPMLKSVGAARRVWRNFEKDPQKNPIDRGVGNYPGTNVQRVQYRRHTLLQRQTWNEFSVTIRQMVVDILTGKIENPGIGAASEFASTRVYYHDRTGKWPSTAEWQSFTKNFNREKWTWVGPISTIDQEKNAFFLDNRLLGVPQDSIRVVLDR